MMRLAAELNLNPKTVSSRLSKCLGRLEKIMTKMLCDGKSARFPSNPYAVAGSKPENGRPAPGLREKAPGGSRRALRLSPDVRARLQEEVRRALGNRPPRPRRAGDFPWPAGCGWPWVERSRRC